MASADEGPPFVIVPVLDSDTLRVRDVAALTALVPLPQRAVRELRDLIDVREARLDEIIEPVRRRLMEGLAQVDVPQVAAAAGPRIREKMASEFDPRTKRSPYPAGHTVYCDVSAAQAPFED